MNKKAISVQSHCTRNVFVIGIVLIIVVCFFVFSRFADNNNGVWICDKGHWVKQGNPIYAKPDDPCGQKITLPRNKEACLQLEGVWKKQGPEPFETCNVKAQDRGNICHDSSECQGSCQVSLTRNELSEGMRGKVFNNKKNGQCSVWIVELGCQGIMKNGKAQVICVD